MMTVGLLFSWSAKGHLDLSHIVTVNLYRMPPESGPFVAQGIDGHHLLGAAVDLQTVAVDDETEVVDLMVRRCHGRLPNAPLLLLAITHDAENTVGLAVHLGRQSHAQRYANPLS